MTKKKNSAKLTEIITTVEQKATGNTVSVGDLVKAIESRGFGALILLPALLTFLPTGGIPGVPGVCAIVIILISVQMLMGRKHAFIPDKIEKLHIRRSKLNGILEKARPVLAAVDRVVTQRLSFMFNPLTERVIAAISIGLALTFFPLAFIPFAVLPSAAAVVLMALGLLARDGLLVILGIVAIGGLALVIPALNF